MTLPSVAAPRLRASRPASIAASATCANASHTKARCGGSARCSQFGGYRTPVCSVARKGPPSPWFGFHSGRSPWRRRVNAYSALGR